MSKKSLTVLTISALFGILTERLYSDAEDVRPVTVWAEERSSSPASSTETHDLTFARRSDGSTVELRTHIAPDGTPMKVRVIHHLPSGTRITVDDTARVTTTYPFDTNRLHHLYKAVKVSCGAMPGSATAVVAGYQVILAERRQARLNSAGLVQSERWLSPELGCAELKRTTSHRDQEGRSHGTYEIQARSVRVGEPDPAFFDVPTDYVEMKPSDAMKELNKAVPSLPPGVSPFANRLDEAHEKLKSEGLVPTRR